MLARGCSFDEATHAYAMEGRAIPSVTRTLDHAGLISYDAVRREILERKSLLGTMVHIATHYFDEGTLDWSSLDDMTKARTEAWAQFRQDTGFTPRLIEERYIGTVNGMTFGLTVDREGLMRGKEVIVEIKNAASKEDWWGIQTAGYAMGVPDPDGKASPRALFARRRRYAVQLFPDGRYKKHDFDDPQDAEVFIWCLGITHWKLNKGSTFRRIEE